MTFSFEDLLTPATQDEVSEKIYDALGIVGISTTSWKAGAVVRTIITACAIILAAMSTLIAAIAKAGFLGLSTGNWLTACAYYVYGVERDEATHATGDVTLANSSGNLYNLDPYDLTVQNSVTDKLYRNTTAITLNPGASGVIEEVEAIEAGAASTAIPGAIDTVVTSLTGVTVTNASAIVGADAQGDASLKTEAQDKLGSLSPNGPRDCYRYFAINAVDADGASLEINRARSAADGLGGVDIWVAKADGAVAGTASNPATDLGACHLSMLSDCAPLGITPTTQSATVSPLAITYTAYVFNTVGDTVAELKAAIELALTVYLSTYPIGGVAIPPAGGELYIGQLEGVIGSVRSEIFKVDVTLPAADVSMAGDLAYYAGVVTGTIVQQAPPTQ